MRPFLPKLVSSTNQLLKFISPFLSVNLILELPCEYVSVCWTSKIPHTHSTFSLVYAFSDKNFFQHFSFYAQPSCNLLPHSKTLDLFIASMPYASENIPHVSLALFPNFTQNLCS